LKYNKKMKKMRKIVCLLLLTFYELLYDWRALSAAFLLSRGFVHVCRLLFSVWSACEGWTRERRKKSFEIIYYFYTYPFHFSLIEFNLCSLLKRIVVKHMINLLFFISIWTNRSLCMMATETLTLWKLAWMYLFLY
jgi:hypothetical protein